MGKRLTDYSTKIANIERAMLNEMWKIIEKRAETDDRYNAPKRFAERTFENEKVFCEVDTNGCTYDVKGIRMEEHWKWGKNISIEDTRGLQYSGLDTNNICILLKALRRQRQRKAEWKRTQQRLAEMRHNY